MTKGLKPTHTPGPWRTVCPPSSDIHKIRYIFDPTDFRVAEVCQLENQGDALANARLIAAAPELLLLAKRIAVALPGDLPGLVREARDAVAKAEGR